MKRLIILLLFFVTCSVASYGQITFSSLTEVSAATISGDTSRQVVLVNPLTNLPVWRGSVGELLKTMGYISNVIGSDQITNGSILDEDISGSAGIGLNKLATSGTGRFMITDSGGSGVWEPGVPGWGLIVDGSVPKVDSGEVATKYDLTQVAAAGGIWEQENSNTLASDNTTDNYHQGNIGVGDFSGTTIGATIHAYDVTNTRLRLSDSAANDTVAQAYVEYYRGYATNKLGQIGYTDNTDLDLHIENHLTGGGIEFRTDNVEKMKLFADGQLSLPYYGDTIYTGTAVKYLAVTDAGLVIEADASGGATAYTPLGTSDAFGSTGDLAYDDNYLYVKTSTGWQRTALSTWVTNYINIDTMPDLFAWYCADSLALSDGASVTSWTDLSGNGHDFSQDTVALQPTYNTADLNGFATITFDGVDDYLFRSDLVWSGGDSIEVYVVVQVADTVTDNYGIMGSFPDKSAFILNIRGSEPDVPAFFMVNSTGSASAYAASGTVSTNWQLINGYYDKTNVGIYYDGTLQDTTAETGAIADDVAKHYIGTYRDNTASRLNGKIAEIIIFSTKHSTARRDMIEAYLGERYNITIN